MHEVEAVLGSELPLSYLEVGATAGLDDGSGATLASRYDVDCREFALGSGRDLFERARSALRAWRQFDIPWFE